MRALGFVLVILTGCAPDGGGAAWAVLHASVQLEGDTLSGYQVWELFGPEWERRQSGEAHRCAVVQTLEGAVAGPLQGCAGCAASWEVVAEPLESDCPDGELRASFLGVSHYAFGTPPAEIDGGGPQPADSTGWYVSFDGLRLEPMGWAWDERVAWGDAADPPGFQVLTPAWGWSLTE